MVEIDDYNPEKICLKLKDSQKKYFSFIDSMREESLSVINNFISTNEIPELFNYNLEVIHKMLEINDWKYKFGAILGISQIFEYLTETNEILKWLDIIESNISCNPMIMLSISIALGLLISDTDFVDLKLEDRIWGLICKFFDSSFSPTRTAGLYILMNFLERCSKNKRQNLFPFMKERLVVAVQSNDQEEISAILPSLYELLAEFPVLMNLHFDEMVNLVFDLGNRFRKKFPLVISELFCFIAKLTKVENYIESNKYIDKIMDFWKSLSDELTENDILVMYPKGFQAIKFYIHQINDYKYFDFIISFSVRIFHIIFQKQNMKKLAKDPDLDEVDKIFEMFVHLDKRQIGFHLEEILLMYLQFINFYLENSTENLKDQIYPLSFILTSLKFFKNDKPLNDKNFLLNTNKSQNKNTMFKDKRDMMLSLINLLENILLTNTKWKVLPEVGNALVEIINYGGSSLKKPDFEFLVDRCFRFMDKYNFLLDNYKEFYMKNNEGKHEEEFEKYFREEIYSFSITLAECFGMIFKHYKSKDVLLMAIDKFDLLELSYDTKITNAKLFLICDILEHVPKLVTSEVLSSFLKILKNYIPDPEVALANAAIFGACLGILQLEGKILITEVRQVWEMLSKHKLLKDETNSDNQFVRDNIIAALGKFVLRMQKVHNLKVLSKSYYTSSVISSNVQSFQNELTDKIGFWISLLPLKQDMVEFVKTINIFSELFQYVNLDSFENNILFKMINFCVICRKTLPNLLSKYVLNNLEVVKYNEMIDSIVSRMMGQERVKGIIGNHFWQKKDLEYLISIKKTIDAGDCFSGLIQQL